MDFTETLAEISWGKGYEAGFRAGWEAREEMEDVELSSTGHSGYCTHPDCRESVK